MYQKPALSRLSDTSYLHCPFKPAKGLQRSNSCSSQRVSLISLVVFLSIFVSVSSGSSPCWFGLLFIFARSVEIDPCISCKAQPKLKIDNVVTFSAILVFLY